MPELISGGTTVPSIRPAPRMLEASRFGTNPACSIASSTLARVAGATSSGLLSARDTVIGASPICRAISRTPMRPTGLRPPPMPWCPRARGSPGGEWFRYQRPATLPRSSARIPPSSRRRPPGTARSCSCWPDRRGRAPPPPPPRRSRPVGPERAEKRRIAGHRAPVVDDRPTPTALMRARPPKAIASPRIPASTAAADAERSGNRRAGSPATAGSRKTIRPVPASAAARAARPGPAPAARPPPAAAASSAAARPAPPPPPRGASPSREQRRRDPGRDRVGVASDGEGPPPFSPCSRRSSRRRPPAPAR